MARENEKRKRVAKDAESSDAESSGIEDLGDLSVSGGSDDELLLEDEMELNDDEAAQDEESPHEPFQNTDRLSRMRTEEDDKKPSFTSAIQRLLEKPTTRKPILSKNTIEKRIDEKKLEAQALKVIKLVKTKVSNREIPIVSEYDRQMRKIATRGGMFNYQYFYSIVVKLFNAIRVAQKSVETVTESTVQKNDRQVPEVLKSKFIGNLAAAEKHVATAEEDHPVPWLKQDFGMKTKHWDEEDEE